MELFSPEFFTALGAIVVIDLVLAGDNAIVIALAARGLPAHLQRKAILWGTVGAVAVRSVMTLAVVWLLGVPGLMLAGGVLLAWIAWRLLAGGGAETVDAADATRAAAATGFWGAMRTIVVADAVMGVDNVLAVGGAAHGSYLLVFLGLAISIPIVVWGSRLVLALIERYPWITYLGAAVLAWTAARMIVEEPLLDHLLDARIGLQVAVYAGMIAAVLGLGFFFNRRRAALALDASRA